MIPDGPLLWYVNRSTGLVLLLLLTATVLLGEWSTRSAAGHRLPGFAVQALHRNVGLLSLAMLTLHIGSAVLDEYVDIRWWQAFAPWQLHYQPLWLALGVVAFDLMLAVVITSLVRARLGHRAWRAVHLSSYAIWGVSVAHGLGIGTDTGETWARWGYVGCAGVVAASVAMRLTGPRVRPGAPVAPGSPLARVGGTRGARRRSGTRGRGSSRSGRARRSSRGWATARAWWPTSAGAARCHVCPPPTSRASPRASTCAAAAAQGSRSPASSAPRPAREARRSSW